MPIVNGRRSITPNTALRLARVLGTSPSFWLNLQLTWDLYREMHSEEAASIREAEANRGDRLGKEV
jgi:plasmid maintenance system antidote protein VapI